VVCDKRQTRKETVDRRKLIIGGAAVILTLGAGGVAFAAQQGEEFSYGLRGEDALHAARGLRSVAHGFATLEVVNGFGSPLDLDESFDRLLRALVAGLRQGEP
jgi:hypothetical protein